MKREPPITDLTLRDYFASSAVGHIWLETDEGVAVLAQKAYAVADAMMRERLVRPYAYVGADLPRTPCADDGHNWIRRLGRDGKQCSRCGLMRME